MKRFFPAVVLSLMLTALLTACTARPADTGSNHTNNTAGSAVTDSTANSRARTGTGNNNGAGTTKGNRAFSNGRYFADRSGDVRDGHDTTIGNDMRDMAGDMMDGVRRAGDTVGNALNDMTHN